MESSDLAVIGGACFGLVIGWITYRTLRRRAGAAQLSDIATVSGAIGGGIVTTFPFNDPDVFGAYAIGLAAGFFLYLVVSLALTDKKGRERVAEVWMGEDK